MVTKAREWPTNQLRTRDSTAMELRIAYRLVEKLYERVSEGKYTREGLEKTLLEIKTHQLKAINHLNRSGANIAID